MNREHLLAFLWLRWRLQANQFRKAGVLNTVLYFMVVGCSIIASIGALVGGFFVGWFALPEAPADVRLFIWGGIVVSFLFFWMIGLLIDLQRTDALALDKFLHLPVSLTGAFLINYFTSWFKLTLVIYVPGLLGLLLGQTVAYGPVMLLGLPLVLAFLVAVTALTYQFQGWLATLMANPRRRRTVVVLVTFGFILLAQTPNIVNLSVRPWEAGSKAFDRQIERRTENNKLRAEQKITNEEWTRREKEISQQHLDETTGDNRRRQESATTIVRLVCTVLPPGWMVLGLAGLPDQSVLPALLGTTGLSLLGALCLWRAYRTTLRLYTGHGSSGGPRAVAPAPAADPKKVRVVEWILPRISEHASAIAAAGFQSLLRAPEAKMVLIAPAIMVIVFGGLALSISESPPAWARPLIAFGVASMTVLSGIQLIGNQFGYDRAGFRVYVLCPVPRHEILIGKNVAVAPMTLGMSVLMALAAGCLYPMRVDRWLAVFLQLGSTYLVFCLLANMMSIFAPLPIKAGAMQASSPRLVPVLIQMLCMMVLPVLLVPILLPFGLEVLLEQLGVVSGWPITLVLSVGVLAGAAALYRAVITWQGGLFARREQQILEVVTSKLE